MSLVERLSGAIGRPDRRGEREFLPAALEVLETPPSPTGRFLALLIVTFFVVAIAWAFLGQVDILASANGRVLPAGNVKVIQPLDPGVVKAIHVQDGDQVTAGQTLVELDPTDAASDRDRVAHDLMQAKLDVARLVALQHAAERGGSPSALGAQAGAPALDVERARAATSAQASEQAAKLGDLSQQIDQKHAEAAEQAAEREKLSASIPLLAEKERIHRELTRQGYGTSLAYLDAQQQASEARHQMDVLSEREAEARSAAGALVRERDASRSQYLSGVLSDLDKAEEKQSELSQELVKAEQKSTETDMKAPISGVVEQLSIHTLGGVVTPAEHLMIIVPQNHSLTVEADLANRDVGFVHAGQPVEVKVETFNFTRYGLLKGHVIGVSRDVVAPDERPEASGRSPSGAGPEPRNPSPSYVARIALDQTDIMIDGRRETLQPGMNVTAEIKTGRRTIIDFLLSPLARHTRESLHER